MFNIITFCFFSYATGETLIAILITFVLEQGVVYFRKRVSEYNLNTKADVDDKFLI